jgi:hypothetical protein
MNCKSIIHILTTRSLSRVVSKASHEIPPLTGSYSPTALKFINQLTEWRTPVNSGDVQALVSLKATLKQMEEQIDTLVRTQMERTRLNYSVRYLILILTC